VRILEIYKLGKWTELHDNIWEGSIDKQYRSPRTVDKMKPFSLPHFHSKHPRLIRSYLMKPLVRPDIFSFSLKLSGTDLAQSIELDTEVRFSKQEYPISSLEKMGTLSELQPLPRLIDFDPLMQVLVSERRDACRRTN
jgi:hypothetical protein